MVHLPYTAMAIERSRFDRINRCLRWALASSVARVALSMLTITL